MISFDRIIKRLRRQLSMSVDEFALNFDLSREQVRAWEDRKSSPSITTLNKLSTMLGITLEEFIEDYCYGRY